MTRKAGAFMLLAALGGGCTSMDKTGPAMSQQAASARTRPMTGVQGPYGEPVVMTAQTNSAVKPAVATKADAQPAIIQAGFKAGKGGGPNAGGTAAPPPGAVAALGSLPGIPVGQPGALGNGRTSVRFTGPAGMKVAWFAPGTPGANNGFTPAQVEVPGRYNFVQGGVYRLKLSDIPNRAATELYPTVEIKPTNYRTCAFLAHSAVPISFTEEDFEQVAAGNFVIKVVYLPDPQFQDLAVAGPDEIVSTRLEPGVDPILEAERRGSILLVIRMGNIDLEAPNTPAMNAPPGGVYPPPGGAYGPQGGPQGPQGPGYPQGAPYGGMLMPPPGGVMPGQMPPPAGQYPPPANLPGGIGAPRNSASAPPMMPLPQAAKPVTGGNVSVGVEGMLGRVK
jgi:hypothetical protein